MKTVTNARPRTWSPRRVCSAVHAAKLSYAEIARQEGCSRPFVSQVASAKVRSLRIASALAAVIGRQPWEIWPRLYAPPSEAPTTAPMAAPDAIATAC